MNFPSEINGKSSGVLKSQTEGVQILKSKILKHEFQFQNGTNHKYVVYIFPNIKSLFFTLSLLWYRK